MTVQIKVEKLTKIFGPRPKKAIPLIEKGISKREILDKTGNTVGVYNANMEIMKGETFVIMGLSGSGKSTLIRCFNLLNKPTSGAIYVDGENIVNYTKEQLKFFRQKKIAMVFQHFGLFSHRTVMENIEYGLEIRGLSKEERRQIAQKNIDIVGLKGYENQYPDELSGGMRQRVGIARALTNDPDILLMDEPFSALDPLIRREMQQELLDIQTRLQKTIIFITHDVNEAFRIGDRVAVMKDGHVEQIGTPEELLESPANDYIVEFTREIDRSKVLQAENIMSKPLSIVNNKDGLHVAIKSMEEHGISSVFITNRERQLLGLVTIDDAIGGVKNRQTLEDVMSTDVVMAHPDEYVQDIIPRVLDSRYPLVVVDETNHIKGIILRVHVLSSMISSAADDDHTEDPVAIDPVIEEMVIDQ